MTTKSMLPSTAKSCTHFTRYDRVYGRPAVAHHEYVLGVGEQHFEIVHGLQRQRVLVTQPGRRDAMSGDHFEYERSDRRVDHLLGHAGLLQPQRFFGRLVPVVAHLQDSRHHPGLLAAPVFA